MAQSPRTVQEESPQQQFLYYISAMMDDDFDVDSQQLCKLTECLLLLNTQLESIFRLPASSALF